MNQNTHGVPVLNWVVLDVKSKLEGRMSEEKRWLELARDAFSRRDFFTGEMERYDSGMMERSVDEDLRSPAWQFRVEWLYEGLVYKFRVYMTIGRDGLPGGYKCDENLTGDGKVVNDPWWRPAGWVDLWVLIPGWSLIRKVFGRWTDSMIADNVIDVFLKGARRMVEACETRKMIVETPEEHGFCGDRPDLGNR